MNTRWTKSRVRLHLTNVSGAGASQLAQSLLPALECDQDVEIEHIYLPDRGPLTAFSASKPSTVAEVYHRHFPNALSRLLECTLLARYFDGDTPLLVLGDIPLGCRGPQTVFLQQSNLLPPKKFDWRPVEFKFALARLAFRMNLSRVNAFIVQTEVMKSALESNYPSVRGRVHVIAQPVPSWLLYSGLHRCDRAEPKSDGLKLLYPASGYGHKNHALLSRLDPLVHWPIKELTLTLDESSHPAPALSWIKCSGFLSTQAMIDAYSKIDAVLFLSKAESYGFPLVEAMFVGLPIVCPDLPYAHTLCGDKAIYFDPDQPDSLREALFRLHSLVEEGWWPDWRERMSRIPKDWQTVARRFLEVACK